MSGSAIKAGQAYVEISARDEKLQQSLEANKQRMNAFAQQAAALGTAMVIAGAAAAVTQFKSFGDELDKMSQRTGVAVESLSALKFAAEQSGSGLSAIETALKGQSRLMLDLSRDTKSAVDTLSELGVTYSELESLSPELRMMRFADAIAAVDDPSQKAALAMKVFGKSGTDLLPLLNGGSDGMRALTEEAESLGLVMSGEAATSAAELTDAWNRMLRATEAVLLKVGGELAPVITQIANMMAHLASGSFEYVVALGAMAAGVGGALVVIKGLNLALALYAQRAIIAAAVSGPAGWIALAAGMAAAGAALGVLNGKLSETQVASQQAASGVDSLGNSSADTAKQIDALADAEKRLNIGRARNAELATNKDELQKIMDGQRTTAEKLTEALDKVAARRRHLEAIKFGGGGKDDKAFTSFQLEDIERGLIDSATGFGDEMKRIRDEVGLLNGTLTETEIKLRDMAEKGLRGSDLEEYRQGLEQLAGLKQAEEAKKMRQKATEEKNDARQRQNDEFQQRADEIRDALKTPAEKFTELVEEQRQLVKAGFIDRQTAAEYLQQQQKEAQAAAKQRLQLPSQRENTTNLRSAEGTTILAQLLNGNQSFEERKLRAQTATATNTKTIADRLGKDETADV